MTAKPPVLQPVKDAYLFLFKNLKHALYVCWPTLAIFLFLLSIIWCYVLAVHFGALNFPTNIKFKLDGIGSFLSVACVFLTVSYFLSFAVLGWHRASLLGVHKANLANPFKPKKEEIEFWGKTIWLYILVLIIFSPIAILGNMMFLPLVPSFVRDIGGIPTFVVFSIFNFMVYYIVSVIIWRFMLYFPAKASGNYIGFGESFSKFKGMTLRFIMASILLYLPYYILSALLDIGSKFLFYKVTSIGKSHLYSFIESWVLSPIDLFISTIVIPFMLVSLLCAYYKWREENPREESTQDDPNLEPSTYDRIVEKKLKEMEQNARIEKLD